MVIAPAWNVFFLLSFDLIDLIMFSLKKISRNASLRKYPGNYHPGLFKYKFLKLFVSFRNIGANKVNLHIFVKTNQL
jgi:hypothetical protein